MIYGVKGGAGDDDDPARTEPRLAPGVLRAALRGLARPGHAPAPSVHRWHLSYVAIGAAAAPGVLHADRLGAALGAFFLAVGVSAHALDELNGRPLRHAAQPRGC